MYNDKWVGYNDTVEDALLGDLIRDGTPSRLHNIQRILQRRL